MIQRIQSLYLLLAALLTSVMMFSPFATFIADGHTYILSLSKISSATGGADIALPLYMGVLAIASILIPVVCIFLYKKRMLQIRLCYVGMIFLGGLQAFVMFYLICANQAVAEAAVHSVNYGFASVMPLAAIFMTYLALRAIIRDESLVRSIDRIR